MKENIIRSLKLILADRVVTVLLAVLVLIAVVYCVYVGISLHPSDLQVAVHYTAFGETGYYREKWYYLLSFIGFGVIVAVVHSALAIKFYILERRQLAIFFIWLSIFLMVIAWFLTANVLRVAFR
jgi:hypothetical protein